MIEMTPAARQHLDAYFQRLSDKLHGTRVEGADEVEQSVREHIEIALEDARAPVSVTDMIAVLDRLGAPEHWVDDIDSVRVGTDDSRLPYVTFGLVLISIATFMFFGFLLLIPAMFVSRAWIEQKRERGEPLGSRRWLVYPAIALVLASTALLLFAAPPLIAANEFRFNSDLRALMVGVWWMIAAGLCAVFVRPIRFVFTPLLDGLHRRHFAVFAAIGALLAAAGGALIYYR